MNGAVVFKFCSLPNGSEDGFNHFLICSGWHSILYFIWQAPTTYSGG